jgi:hypothetical protein
MSNAQETGTKRKIKFTYVISAIAIACLMIGTAFGMMISATTPTTPTVIEPGSNVGTADYVLFKDGSTYYAKNGTTGAMQTSSASAIVVMQYALNRPGKTIVVNGIWDIVPGVTYGLLIARSNSILEIGSQATIRLADSSPTTGSIIQVGTGAGLNNVQILGPGVIDGNRANNAGGAVESHRTIFIWGACENVTIKNLNINHEVGDAIYLNGNTIATRSRYVSIENNVIADCGEGVLFQYCTHVSVNHNTITNIDPQDGIEPAGGATNWTISDNVITQTTQSGIDVFNGASSGTIENNILLNTNCGLDVGSSGGAACKDIIVEGNLVNGTTGAYPGIWTGTIANARISIIGNTVRNSADRGIYIQSPSVDCQVIGNFVYNSADAGIVSAGTRTIVSDNNCLSNGAAGISIIDNALVNGNYCYLNAGQGLIVQGDGATITGNFILKNGVDGIFHLGSHSLVDANVCVNNDQSNGASLSGIRINAGSNLTVTNNVCYDDQVVKTQYFGIYVQAVTYSLIEGNNLFGNKNAELLDQGGTGTLIRWNVGYVTETSGNRSATGTVNFVSFNHGLVATPTLTLVTPVQLGCNYSVTANSTKITITFDAQPGAATWYFMWYAQTW